jgi:hypothetical protein
MTIIIFKSMEEKYDKTQVELPSKRKDASKNYLSNGRQRK